MLGHNMSGKDNRPEVKRAEPQEVKRAEQPEVTRRGPDLRDDSVLIVESGRVVQLETNGKFVKEGQEVKASALQGGTEGARTLLKKRAVRLK